MSDDLNSSPTNSRRISQEGDRRNLYVVIFTLVVVGGLLIALIFGTESLLTALPCLIGGAVLILLPWFVLNIIQRWRDGIDFRAHHEAEAIAVRKTAKQTHNQKEG